MLHQRYEVLQRMNAKLAVSLAPNTYTPPAATPTGPLAPKPLPPRQSWIGPILYANQPLICHLWNTAWLGSWERWCKRSGASWACGRGPPSLRWLSSSPSSSSASPTAGPSALGPSAGRLRGYGLPSKYDLIEVSIKLAKEAEAEGDIIGGLVFIGICHVSFFRGYLFI